ncbi:defective in cullin neddylation protein [Rhizoctonia solani AG-3 Rhs1AP]|uniref:Defective in cullin neddylation protein n=1 Tax=Rhizoctonia solani AG-3 Rhs1AP TaxID=1086054 RepID=X8JW22_9AGAM|nr:defective in cullin neddylation protein [Rhizoctonia solani AG-3 Rhs1AP]
MPPKRKAAESATERSTKTRRASAKEAAAKPTKSAPATRKGAKEKATAVSSGLDPATFTLERVQAMFDKYTDEDDSNIIGAEGMERLCTDASVPMDGALPLLIAWSVNAKTLGTITRSEFTDSFGKLKIDTPQKMALMASDLNSVFFGCNIAEQASRMSIANNGHGVDSYDRTQLRSYQRNAESAYSKFYSFCFILVKPPQSRNIDMETAAAFWSVILAPKYPIAGELLEFITEKGTYKAVTKDLWGMMLEFCRTVQLDLSGHDEEEAAWPTLLDDFVEWKKAKPTGQNGDAVMSD